MAIDTRFTVAGNELRLAQQLPAGATSVRLTKAGFEDLIHSFTVGTANVAPTLSMPSTATLAAGSRDIATLTVSGDTTGFDFVSNPNLLAQVSSGIKVPRCDLV